MHKLNVRYLEHRRWTYVHLNLVRYFWSVHGDGVIDPLTLCSIAQITILALSICGSLIQGIVFCVGGWGP